MYKNVMKYKFIFKYIVIFLISILCSVYFYNQLIHVIRPIHSDDAAMAVDFKNVIELGAVMPISRRLNIFVWVIYLLYRIWGCTEFFIQIGFTINYFVCCFLSLYICSINEDTRKLNWKYLGLFIFMVGMPGSFGESSVQVIKFHILAMICFLAFLAYIHMFKNKENIILNIVVISFIFFTGFIIQDILFFVIAIIPLVLYYFFYMLKNGFIKAKINLILICVSLVIMTGRIFLGSWQYAGYGSRVFAEPSEVLQNIDFGIKGFLSMFNIPILGETIIQFNTIIYIIRLGLLALAFGIVLRNIFFLVKFEKGKVPFIDAILSLSVLSVILAYLFSGVQEDEISVRYMSSIYFSLIIILIRYLSEMAVSRNTLGLKSNIILNLFFAICITSYIEPINLVREDNELDRYANYIKEQDELKYGLGEFWRANVIAPLTGGEVHIQAVSGSQSQAEPYLSLWEPYKMGTLFFNFFVENRENPSMGEYKIKDVFGEHVKKHSMENTDIYIYDYDIRFKKGYLNGDSLNLVKSEKCYARGDNIIIPENEKIIFEGLNFFVGTYRIKIEGENLYNNVQFLLNTESDFWEARLVHTSKNEVIFDVDIFGALDGVDITIKNISSSFEFEHCEISVINAAAPILLKKDDDGVQCGEYSLSEGIYNLIFEGENLKNLNIKCTLNNEHLPIKKVNSGEKRYVFEINLPQKGRLCVYPKGCTIDTCGVETPYEKRKSIEGKVRLYKVNSGILSEDGYKNKDGIMLKRDQIAYGPYTVLERGRYIININGENLDKSKIWFTAEAGTKEVTSAYCVFQKSNKAFYYLNIENGTSDFEIIVKNIADDIVGVESYLINQIADVTEYTIDNGLFIKHVGETNDVNSSLELNDYVYGPYISLKAGVYMCRIKGENINNVDIVATVNSGKDRVEDIKILSSDKEEMLVQINLKKDAEKFELISKNVSNEIVVINRYEFSKE